MSLTSLLKYNSDMINLFKKIPNLKRLIKIDGIDCFDFRDIPIKAPLVTSNPQLIGHAYDEFLQLFCRRLNNIKLNIQYSFDENDEFPELAKNDFNSELNSYVDGITDWNDDLSKQSIILGKIDQYSRCGVPPVNIININMNDLEDINNLISVTLNRNNLFRAKYRFIPNPHFGESITALIGGADADLLVDDTLIDIKVLSKMKYDSYPWKQLIGYYILALFSPNKLYTINRIAIWNPRFDLFMYIDIDELKEELNLKQFVYDFIETLYCIHKDNTRTPSFLKLIRNIETRWENIIKIGF